MIFDYKTAQFRVPWMLNLGSNQNKMKQIALVCVCSSQTIFYVFILVSFVTNKKNNDKWLYNGFKWELQILIFVGKYTIVSINS